jgi:hypothetical protein
VCIGLEIGPPVESVGEHDVFRLPEGEGAEDAADVELDALTSEEIRLPLRDLVEKSLADGVRMLEGLGRWKGPEGAETARRALPAFKERRKIGRPPT